MVWRGALFLVMGELLLLLKHAEAWAGSLSPRTPRLQSVFFMTAAQTGATPGAAGRAGSAAAFPSSRIKLNGVEHYVRDTGDPAPSAPIAVLLHGFAGNTDSWEDVAPLLYAGGVRAVAVDRVGFGRTERPTPPTLPPPPPLPGREILASSLESLVDSSASPASGLQALIPDPRKALATALRRPTTLAPRLPWELSTLGKDPYSSTFAVSALSPLLKSIATSPGERPVYFVGHSAGGPLALRALCEAVSDKAFLPPRTTVGGVILVAPAVLDPEEDPDAYNSDGSTDNLPLPVRIAAFQAILALPDAFSIGTARRLADRNVTEALLNQTHARLAEQPDRVAALVAKYAAPVKEFPSDWDTALINVYRADFGARGDNTILTGRQLLSAARRSSVRMAVVTGDDDRIVPVRASRRVAELLAAEEILEMEEVGHLPMDEKPEEFAQIMLRFIGS